MFRKKNYSNEVIKETYGNELYGACVSENINFETLDDMEKS